MFIHTTYDNHINIIISIHVIMYIIYYILDIRLIQDFCLQSLNKTVFGPFPNFGSPCCVGAWLLRVAGEGGYSCECAKQTLLLIKLSLILLTNHAYIYTIYTMCFENLRCADQNLRIAAVCYLVMKGFKIPSAPLLLSKRQPG